jgi:hypothetical protein
MIGPMTEGVSAIADRLRAIQALLAAAPGAAVPASTRITRDGRIYPPDQDEKKVSTVEGARRYRTRGHNVYIGENGAIAFENVKTKLIEFSKPGSDGKEIEK